MISNNRFLMITISLMGVLALMAPATLTLINAFGLDDKVLIIGATSNLMLCFIASVIFITFFICGIKLDSSIEDGKVTQTKYVGPYVILMTITTFQTIVLIATIPSIILGILTIGMGASWLAIMLRGNLNEVEEQ